MSPVPEGQLQLIGNGRPPEPGIRARMERFFGADFSGVRVHEGPAAPAMGALAFTLGETLYVAPGLYDPTMREGGEFSNSGNDYHINFKLADHEDGHQMYHVTDKSKTGRRLHRKRSSP